MLFIVLASSSFRARLANPEPPKRPRSVHSPWAEIVDVTSRELPGELHLSPVFIEKDYTSPVRLQFIFLVTSSSSTYKKKKEFPSLSSRHYCATGKSFFFLISFSTGTRILHLYLSTTIFPYFTFLSEPYDASHLFHAPVAHPDRLAD